MPAESRDVGCSPPYSHYIGLSPRPNSLSDTCRSILRRLLHFSFIALASYAEQSFATGVCKLELVTDHSVAKCCSSAVDKVLSVTTTFGRRPAWSQCSIQGFSLFLHVQVRYTTLRHNVANTILYCVIYSHRLHHNQCRVIVCIAIDHHRLV